MSFQQALSGLNATSKSLEVIGNNIANASTYGAKAARAEFADVYAAALNGAGTNQVGIGVDLAAVAQQFTQGNIESTDNPMDLAINGAGFFQVQNGANQINYTRNGQFKLDKDGFIINNAGERLLGYPADGTGNILPGVAGPLQLALGGIAPQPTSNIDMQLNLDSRVAATLPATAPQINFSDPSTYNNATSMTVYDAKGQDIALTYYFQKAGTDLWNVYVTANGTTLAGTAAAPLPVTSIQFASNGSAPTAPTFPLSIDIPASTNSSGAQTLAVTGVQLDMGSATQYGAGFGITDITQDGFAPGQLTSVMVERSGIIMARYSNGQSQPAGQVEIANFRNPQGLQPLGGNDWGRTFTSGEPVLGVPGQGNLGLLQSGALEESNVDLTGELVKMITAQRVYQANAQSIKTEDQVLQTLVNMR